MFEISQIIFFGIAVAVFVYLFVRFSKTNNKKRDNASGNRDKRDTASSGNKEKEKNKEKKEPKKEKKRTKQRKKKTTTKKTNGKESTSKKTPIKVRQGPDDDANNPEKILNFLKGMEYQQGGSNSKKK